MGQHIPGCGDLPWWWGSRLCPAHAAGGAVGGCRRSRLPPARLRVAGWHRLPTGLEDVSTYPALVAELLARNWTEAEVRAALAENLLRVFRKVEEVSRAWGGTGHGDGRDKRDIRMYSTWGCMGTWGGTGARRAGDEGGHGDVQGSGWHGDVRRDRRPPSLPWPLAARAHPVPPSQVKRSLQGMAAHETPIAFEALEGTCRTRYGYTNGASTSRLPLAALALALLHSLLS